MRGEYILFRNVEHCETGSAGEGVGVAMRLKVYPHPSTPALLISNFLTVLFI